MSEESQKLTPKEKLFIEKYLGEAHFNGTKAAELAGYKGSKNTLGVVAYDNLRKPKIKDEIDCVLSAMTMPSNVVLTRLTEIAEGSIDDVLDESGKFSFEKAIQNNKTGLIKKLKRKSTSKKVDAFNEENEEGEETTLEISIVFEEVEFEMYSAHEALRDLGKYHKLFTDKTELTGKDGGAIQTENKHKFVDDILKNYGKDADTNRD